MATPERYVIDTNVLVSFLLFYGSVPGQAVKAWRTGVLLRSDSTLSELARALERPTFDRYLTRYERAIFRQRFIQDTGEPRRERRQVPGACRSRPSHVHHHGRFRFA
jgi:predicted nucleic acid-binding protein